jgi:hypothetical protein
MKIKEYKLAYDEGVLTVSFKRINKESSLSNFMAASYQIENNSLIIEYRYNDAISIKRVKVENISNEDKQELIKNKSIKIIEESIFNSDYVIFNTMVQN